MPKTVKCIEIVLRENQIHQNKNFKISWLTFRRSLGSETLLRNRK